MEGAGRGRRPPLEVQREFAASRLEEQILIRVFELVVPVFRRSVVKNQRSTAALEPVAEPVELHITKGA